MLRQLRIKFVVINMALVSLVLLIVFVALCLSTYTRLSTEADRTLRGQIEFGGQIFRPEIGGKPSGWQDRNPSDQQTEDDSASGSSEVSAEGTSGTENASEGSAADTSGTEDASGGSGGELSDAAPGFEKDPGAGRDPNGTEGAGHNVGNLEPVFYVKLDADGSILFTQTHNVTISEENLQLAIDAALAADAEGGDISAMNLRYLRIRQEDGQTCIAFLDMTGRTDSMRQLVLQSLAVGLGGLVCFFFISLLLSRLALKPVETAWSQQRQFVADASHELKTPLTVILANMSILLSHPEDTVGQQKKWVENTQDEGRRMKGLIDDMLYLAKSDARKDATAHLRFCLSDEAERSALRFESLAFERGVTLETLITPELYMKGDQAAIRQLLGTLLDNACKYAGAEGKALLRLRRSGDTLLLSVWNTGDPIPPESLPRLFDRFYRGDSARDGAHAGYGLGLAIAKSVAEIHGGRITVESRAGEGTIFTVRLTACR